MVNSPIEVSIPYLRWLAPGVIKDGSQLCSPWGLKVYMWSQSQCDSVSALTQLGQWWTILLPVTLPILYIPFHISSAVWVKSYNSCSPLVRSLSFVSCHRRWGGWWPDKKMDPWDIPILSFCRLRRSLNTTVLTNLRSDNKVAFKLFHEARDLIYFGQASGWRRPLKLSANYRGLWISGARVVRPPGCH